MKKLFVAVMVLGASVTAAKAQFYVGGSLGFWHDPKKSTSYDTSYEIITIHSKSTSFWIEPDAGYSFNERWTVGLSIGFQFIRYSDTWSDGAYENENEISFYVSPYARFNYFSKDKIKLFLDGVVGVSAENAAESFGFQVIIRPGIAIHLTEHFSLVGTFGALGYRQNYRYTRDGFGLDLSNSLGFGFYYSF